MKKAMQQAGFTVHDLDDRCVIYRGRLPRHLIWTEAVFHAAWLLHPVDRHWIKMLGKPVQTPRWQQAYGATYSYTGSDNTALPIPRSLETLLNWSREVIEARLNGLLLNWYAGPSDYIGPHHDSTKSLVVGTPIVTISFGEDRIFRLSRSKRKDKRTFDLPAAHGTVTVIPWETNLRWKHAVPKRARYAARRISVTLRAFADGVLPPHLFLESTTQTSGNL